MRNSVQTLIKAGGKEWVKGDDHRIYFSNNIIADLIGLKIYYNGKGNISSATLKGEKISNSSARNYLPAQFYYDVNADQYYAIACSTEIAQEIIDAINVRGQDDA